ncbi:MAG: DUF192 domain-containing protein [Actinobacteria bacterium]|nr:DUF192 domain-containing protein [Actinomycetota bacterium]
MTRRAVGVIGLVALLLIAVGCGSSGSANGKITPQSTSAAEASLRSSGFTKVTLRIRHADGSTEVRCVWLADTEVERGRGLKEITDPSIGGGEAMVFLWALDTTATFGMKDTLLPLSIAWIDSVGAFVSSADMDPCPAGTTNCPLFPAARPYRLAIEMAQGRLQDWGIGPDVTVTLAEAC